MEQKLWEIEEELKIERQRCQEQQIQVHASKKCISGSDFSTFFSAWSTDLFIISQPYNLPLGSCCRCFVLFWSCLFVFFPSQRTLTHRLGPHTIPHHPHPLSLPGLVTFSLRQKRGVLCTRRAMTCLRSIMVGGGVEECGFLMRYLSWHFQHLRSGKPFLISLSKIKSSVFSEWCRCACMIYH